MIAWGADIGFRRVSLAGADADRSLLHVEQRVTFPADQGSDPEAMLALQQVTKDAAYVLARELGGPDLIVVEEPTVQKKRSNEKVHYGYALVCAALVPLGVPVIGLKVNTCRMLALGEGFGRADKNVVLAWARRFGYSGSSHDDADALCCAAAGLQHLRAQAEPDHEQMTLG